jgi:hypothetical protein
VSDELNNAVAKLRADLIVHGAIIKALLHVIKIHIPESDIPGKLQEIYADTILHSIPDMPPLLADYLPAGFHSFSVAPKEPL